MSNKNISTNSLPKLPKMRKGGNGVCLCGCAAHTSGGRFAPGHDARLLAWTLRVERGIVDQAPEPHTASVEIERKLRADAGLTGESHAKAQITAADAAGIAREPKTKKRGTRLVKVNKVAEVAKPPVMEDEASDAAVNQ